MGDPINDIQVAAAAGDQMVAIIRDAWAGSFVGIEKMLLDRGASPELACGIALAYATGLIYGAMNAVTPEEGSK